MFEPDYKNVENAARNIKAARISLYDHSVAFGIIEKLTNKPLNEYFSGEKKNLPLLFKRYCEFFRDYGYDTVTLEYCVTSMLPHGECVAGVGNPSSFYCTEGSKLALEKIPVGAFIQIE